MNEIDNLISQLERQRMAIDNAIEALRGVSGASQPAKKGAGIPKGRKKTVIPEGRQRQIEAMRKYWAEKKSAGKKPTKKRGLTAAGRKKLSENMKRMWAEKKLGTKRAARKTA